jgi:hypothetical protein
MNDPSRPSLRLSVPHHLVWPSPPQSINIHHGHHRFQSTRSRPTFTHLQPPSRAVTPLTATIAIHHHRTTIRFFRQTNRLWLAQRSLLPILARNDLIRILNYPGLVSKAWWYYLQSLSCKLHAHVCLCAQIQYYKYTNVILFYVGDLRIFK